MKSKNKSRSKAEVAWCLELSGCGDRHATVASQFIPPMIKLKDNYFHHVLLMFPEFLSF